MNISIDQLAEAVAKKISMAIPLDVAQWNTKQCAEYLGVTARHFNAHIKVQVGFPASRRLPSAPLAKSDAGRERWKAQEVIEWFEGR